MDIIGWTELDNNSISPSDVLMIYGCKESSYLYNKKKYLNNISDKNIQVYHCYFGNEMFEESVRIISSIEDTLGIDIPYISIAFNCGIEKTNLIEFYGYSKEYILTCYTASDIINSIAFIECNKYNNVYIGLSSELVSSWCINRELFYAIKKYLISICCYGNDRELSSYLETYGYNKFLIFNR